MVEQWPFKPLVKGSSPFSLTDNSSDTRKGVFDSSVGAPSGDAFEPPRSQYTRKGVLININVYR